MRLLSLWLLLGVSAPAFAEPDPTRFFTDKSSADGRLGKPNNLDGYFPFTPPKTIGAWEHRATELRQQLLVSLGLWPMPEKTPLNPVVHSPIERDGYTIEKVFFASLPGHYVTGNLYRPTGRVAGKRPAILTAHGHWPPEGPGGGRNYEARDDQAKQQIKIGAEKTMEGAKYPLQARCAQLAKMGFVVFFYDMIGYADSQALKHRISFGSVESELRLQSAMGLQTWNSIRALDFLLSLKDVDAKRVGMTGASGGGTQTFILAALDDRIAAAHPAVMVSTAMQGGCQCENASYLRIDTGNVEFAALFAPKPLSMSAANDWTKEIMTKGYPELQALYALYGKEANVIARCWPEFDHNYNQVAREMMYEWFNKHLLGGSGPVPEAPFKPVPPKELAVFDATHPRPKDELDAAALNKALSAISAKLIDPLAGTSQYFDVFGVAQRILVMDRLPKPAEFAIKGGPKQVQIDGLTMHLALLGRKNETDQLPTAGVFSKAFTGDKVVIWVHPNGKSSLFADGKLVPAARTLVDAGYAVVSPDVFRTGELTSDKPWPVDAKFPPYTFGYNRTTFANRVHDIHTTIAFARDILKAKTIHLVGWDGAGPWVAAARSQGGTLIQKTVIDGQQFRFEDVATATDANFVPGAVKYGGLPMFVALAAKGSTAGQSVIVHNANEKSSFEVARKAFAMDGAKGTFASQPKKLGAADVVGLLLKSLQK
jgi:dienelactone hydrolase